MKRVSLYAPHTNPISSQSQAIRTSERRNEGEKSIGMTGFERARFKVIFLWKETH